MQFLEDQRIEKLREKFLTYSAEFGKCLVDGIVQVSVNPCKDAEFKFNMMLLSIVNFIIVSCKNRQTLLKTWVRIWVSFSDFRSSGSLLVSITLYLLLFFNLALKSRWLDPTGKVIFITNVDSGYGQELAKYLINRGAKVIAGASDPMASSLLQLREDGVYLIKFDISSDEKLNESMMRLRLRLSTWSKDLHGVVVNSGVDAFGDFEWSGVKYLKKITEINVWQIAELVKDLLEVRLKSKAQALESAIWVRVLRIQISKPSSSRIISFFQARASPEIALSNRIPLQSLGRPPWTGKSAPNAVEKRITLLSHSSSKRKQEFKRLLQLNLPGCLLLQ